MTHAQCGPIALLITTLLLVVWFVISRLSIQELIICTVDDEAFVIPSGACGLYLHNFTDEDDATELEQAAGLAYVFGLDEQNTKYQIIDCLLTIGVSVNDTSKTDGLTPLNTAILLNDAALVGYLIQHGADVSIKDKAHQMNAREYTRFLVEHDRSQDRSEIQAILGGRGLSQR